MTTHIEDLSLENIVPDLDESVADALRLINERFGDISGRLDPEKRTASFTIKFDLIHDVRLGTTLVEAKVDRLKLPGPRPVVNSVRMGKRKGAKLLGPKVEVDDFRGTVLPFAEAASDSDPDAE